MSELFKPIRQLLRLDEDRRPVDRLQVEGKLGAGTYGEVFACTDLTNGRAVAMKKIQINMADELTPLLFLREVSSLRATSSHPCIVKLLDVSYLDGEASLVFELLDCDLRRYLRGLFCPLPAGHVSYIFWQLCSAVEYCHRQRLVHRDIKPQNILLNLQTGRIKLADFGLSKIVSDSREKLWTREVVTLWYRSPEILLGAKTHGPGIDLWSLGAILMELTNSKPLFPGNSEIETAFKIFAMVGSPNDETISTWPWYSPQFPSWSRSSALANLSAFSPSTSKDVIHIAHQLLMVEPKQRMHVSQVLKSDWLADVDEQDVVSDSFILPGWQAVESNAVESRSISESTESSNEGSKESSSGSWHCA